jgi:GTP cyclohydrolase I
MSKAIETIIKKRIAKDGGKFFCNDNISKYIQNESELCCIERDVEMKIEELLQCLIIDTENDHNTKDTAKRMAKMFIHEIFRGRYREQPKITTFPNATDYDQLYITGPVSIRSTCAHHFQNIVGKAYVGVFPGKEVIGLSKFNRLIHWIAERPQIQEEMTMQIADAVEEVTGADGVAIVMRAEHMCMTHRGVKEHESDMTTSVMRGVFRDDPELKKEFLTLMQEMR